MKKKKKKKIEKEREIQKLIHSISLKLRDIAIYNEKPNYRNRTEILLRISLNLVGLLF